jgi:hypothetical protein
MYAYLHSLDKPRGGVYYSIPIDFFMNSLSTVLSQHRVNGRK